ncbi:DapH/DapD/GlmU-related protein [Vibrio cholerae]
MFRIALNFVFKILKRRPLKLDADITSKDLIYIFFSNIPSLLRGLIFYRKLISIGSKCNIYKVKFGKGVTVGNNVTMNGIGKHSIVLGDNVSIYSHCVLKVSGTYTLLGESIIIGCGVGIGDFSHIGGAGGISIGDGTIIGPYFSAHPENHIFNNLDVPIKEQGLTRRGISIGKDCWIGAKVTILDGASIGNGCIIAAGAVVRGEFPDNSIIAGVPAKVIRRRGN